MLSRNIMRCPMRLTPPGATTLAERIASALRGPAVLRDWDQRFLQDMLHRLAQGGAREPGQLDGASASRGG